MEEEGQVAQIQVEAEKNVCDIFERERGEG